MDDVSLKLLLERFEVGELPTPEEFVFDVPEQLLRRPVVDAVALAGHALHYARPLQPAAITRVLVLPSHIGLHDRVGALRDLRDEHVEHLLLLGHVRVLRYRPCGDLLAAEVVRRREVRLAPLLFELGHVGSELLPRNVGGEVPGQHVLEGLAYQAPVGVVPVVVGLAPDAAADAHLVHHLEHGLVRDDGVLLGAQAHRDLAVPAAVGRPREDLRHLLPQLRPGRRLAGLGLVVMVGRRRDARCGQQILERMPLP